MDCMGRYQVYKKAGASVSCLRVRDDGVMDSGCGIGAAAVVSSLPNMRLSGRAVNELPVVLRRRAAQLWR